MTPHPFPWRPDFRDDTWVVLDAQGALVADGLDRDTAARVAAADRDPDDTDYESGPSVQELRQVEQEVLCARALVLRFLAGDPTVDEDARDEWWVEEAEVLRG